MLRLVQASFPCRTCVLAVVLLWACTQSSEAIIFYSTGDVNHNTTAPTGSFEDSGWQYEVKYGSFLGTIIGSQYVITAQHFGTQGATLVHSGIFNGGSDVVYNIDAAFNGGAGYQDIAGTDLRIIKVQELFPYYAPIFTGTLQSGLTLVTHGMGGPRGDEILVGGDLQGWEHGPADGTPRWGSNTIQSVYPSAIGDLIKASFSADGTTEEATLSVGDSGGGVFVNDNGIWKLAGVNYSVDGYFDTNTTVGDGSEFDAALFERDGLYQGSDAFGWSAAPAGPSSMYASSVTGNAATIMSIALVPEPHSAFLVMIALTGGVLQRRRVTPQA